MTFSFPSLLLVTLLFEELLLQSIDLRIGAQCNVTLWDWLTCALRVDWLQYTEWPKKMYTLFTHQYLWNKLWQCLDADGGHFEHLHWIQNSRTFLISILILYKYSSYDYRVIFFMSKSVYIILGHSVLIFKGWQPNKLKLRDCSAFRKIMSLYLWFEERWRILCTYI